MGKLAGIMGDVIVVFFPLGLVPLNDVDGIHSRELCSTIRPSGNSIRTMFSEYKTALGQVHEADEVEVGVEVDGEAQSGVESGVQFAWS